jgi:hypothetical protein
MIFLCPFRGSLNKGKGVPLQTGQQKYGATHSLSGQYMEWSVQLHYQAA